MSEETNTTSNESEIVEAVQAVVDTVEDPNPVNLVRDLEIAIKLVKKLKAQIQGLHPSVSEFIRKLI